MSDVEIDYYKLSNKQKNELKEQIELDEYNKLLINNLKAICDIEGIDYTVRYCGKEFQSLDIQTRTFKMDVCEQECMRETEFDVSFEINKVFTTEDVIDEDLKKLKKIIYCLHKLVKELPELNELSVF